MGAIIRMESKKFIKDFMPEFNHKEYQFILVSEFITTRNEFKNVKAMPKLMPPPNIIKAFIEGDKKGYQKAYLQYLQIPNVEALLSIIIKAAIVNDMKIVLMCSQSENEFGYLKYICEYIEAVYKMKTFTLKEFSKDPEKASKVKNKDEVMKILGKKFERMEKTGVDLTTKTDKEKYVKELKKMGRKGMKKLAKKKGIKIDDGDLTKEEFAKKLAKKLLA